MGGASYIGQGLGDGPIFEISVSCRRTHTYGNTWEFLGGDPRVPPINTSMHMIVIIWR